MTDITLKKYEMRWLFGGIGFHNSEATMLGIMSDEFRDQRVLKTFREISPTYARVFTGYADWSKEAMDEFADYYDLTFRQANTTLYLVPGRLPYRTSDFDMDAYAEKVACNLEYLIRERGCTKIRHYCLTNELACGNGRPLIYHFDEFREMQEALYRAFRRHDLKIGLLAMDSSGMSNVWNCQDWAMENMDEITECYCHHFYLKDYVPGEPRMYMELERTLSLLVSRSLSKEKRFVLGEFGLNDSPTERQPAMMRSDRGGHVDRPELDNLLAVQLAEFSICAVNTGCLAAANWTLFDYPDPFLNEDGDTPEEKARFRAANFSGHGVSIRYNKHGKVRWCDEEHDYRAYASLYTMGYMAKLFRKGSRILMPEFDNGSLRACAVTNPDGSCSSALVNWNDTPEEVCLRFEQHIAKPFRRYLYLAGDPPFNDFNDLQDYTDLISCTEDTCTVTLPPQSVTFLTTDYAERTPSAVTGVKCAGNILSWNACTDAEHCYYRVYRDGVQIASTVACTLPVDDAKAAYGVYSVDRYGNCAV